MRWLITLLVFLILNQLWAQEDHASEPQKSSPVSLHCSVCNAHLGYLLVENLDLDKLYYHILAEQMGLVDTTYYCTTCRTALFASHDLSQSQEGWLYFDETTDRKQLEITNLNNPPEDQAQRYSPTSIS